MMLENGLNVVLVLTGDSCGVSKSLSNCRVHLDHLVLLNSHFLVSVLNVLIHPFLEGFANDGEDDVSQVLSMKLLDLCFDW